MDKQIEEMVLAVYPWLKEVPIEERNQLKENVSGLMVMERLYNAGYRKIPENAVVLTVTENEERFIDLLIEFDEMGFEPTTLPPKDMGNENIQRFGKIGYYTLFQRQ